MKERNVVDALIVNDNLEFLLQKKTLDYPKCPGKWVFFGGEMENDEEPIKTLKRELAEELGIDEKEIKEEGIKLYKKEHYEIKDLNGQEFFGYRIIFIVKLNIEISEIRLAEGAGFAFFHFSEIDSADLENMCKKTIKEYVKNKKKYKSHLTLM